MHIDPYIGKIIIFSLFYNNRKVNDYFSFANCMIKLMIKTFRI